MKQWFIKIWNKIFGKTIFAIYYDNRKVKKKNKKNNNKTNAIAASNRLVHVNDVAIIDLDKETNVLDVDLVDDNASEKDKKSIRTFTKKWVDIILTISLIDVQLVFILAFFGKEQIAENLGMCIVTEVVAIAIGYFIKAFMESYSVGKHEEEMERIKRDYNVEPKVPTNDESSDEEAVG